MPVLPINPPQVLNIASDALNDRAPGILADLEAMVHCCVREPEMLEATRKALRVMREAAEVLEELQR